MKAEEEKSVSTIKTSLSSSKLASSKEYREAFVSSFLKRYIPFQIRTIRKKRSLTQPQLATASKITQGVVSRSEDPDYGNLTFNTVLRIAAGYDLAFIGKFVRFSEFLKIVDEMSEDSLDLPGFEQELATELENESAAIPIEEKLGQVAPTLDPQPEQDTPEPLAELAPHGRSNLYEIPKKGTGRLLGDAQSQLDQFRMPA